ncbi:hypothetical protein UC8_23730 [Roseimaritima ulvae]|uniref:Uncharacterized protein n=1 Tax=Roseimaritima ulvae TaxID=980254 RepID=A0A5B9QN27_9BACT|nr:hypothetical protein UC8_23730 [Roseimaritima ulvae]
MANNRLLDKDLGPHSSLASTGRGGGSQATVGRPGLPLGRGSLLKAAQFCQNGYTRLVISFTPRVLSSLLPPLGAQWRG